MLDTAKSCQVTIGRNLERCPRILPNIFFEAPKAQRAPSKVIAGIRDGLNSGYAPKFLSKRRRIEAAIFLTGVYRQAINLLEENSPHLKPGGGPLNFIPNNP